MCERMNWIQLVQVSASHSRQHNKEHWGSTQLSEFFLNLKGYLLFQKEFVSRICIVT
jgi:hypothetical protein